MSSVTNFLVYFAFLASCLAYNIDIKTSNARVFSGAQKSGSYFGYSLAFIGSTFSPRVLVGAPRDTSLTEEKGGGVYQCHIKAPSSCVFHDIRSGDRYDKNTELREDQWLGASVYSLGFGDKPYIVCAPRYSQISPGNDGSKLYFPVGKCYHFLSLFKKETVIPCTTRPLGNRPAFRQSTQYGFSEAGWSAIIQKTTSQNVVMGAVGAKRDIGEAMRQRDAKIHLFDFAPSHETDGFFVGYSVASGKFDAKEEVAAGSPRGSVSGKVIIYSEDVKHIPQTVFPPPRVRDEKEYIYFGASVCAVDINGDGFSDLLVGAPFYSVEGKGDEGRVYVYLSRLTGTQRVLQLAYGENDFDPGLRGDNNMGARFGWTIAAAGDLNDDTFQDVVIGAPHDQPDIDNDGLGNGAIYIYHGLNSGEMKNYQQRITAEDVGHYFKPFKQFGYSVVANEDTNSDKYPDIAVGSWDSGKVLLLRTRPVMDITKSLELSKQEIPVDDTFVPNCRDGSKKQCINATVCFQYLGKSVSGKQVLKYEFEVDAEVKLKGARRVYIDDGGNKVYQLTGTVEMAKRGEKICKDFENIYVEGSESLANSQSGKKGISFQVRYELQLDASCETTALCPILDKSQEAFVEKKAALIYNCSNNKCDYDLTMKLSFSQNNITIGKTKNVNVTVTLGNKNENAYNPEVTVHHDASLQYEKLIPLDKSIRIERRTIASGNASTTELFRVQGVLEQGQEVSFKLQYSTRNVYGEKRQLSVFASAAGTPEDQESNINDNNATAYILVRRDVFISIESTSVPAALTYPIEVPGIGGVTIGDRTNYTNVNASAIGPLVTVTFSFSNERDGPLQSIDISIFYPLRESKTEQEYIMYPVDLKARSDNGVCNTSLLNPEMIQDEGLKSRQKRETKKRGHRSTSFGTLECKINELASKQRFVVEFQSRLWIKTLAKFNPDDVQLELLARARYTNALDEKDPNKNFEETLSIRLTPENPAAKKKTTPVWIIIVSILGGVLLLCLAIFALFKFGFFKRNRPPKDISSPTSDDAPVVPP